jgi:hypothetical protein
VSHGFSIAVALIAAVALLLAAMLYATTAA